MTQKRRVPTIPDQRAGLPVVSFGDKPYKAVEYEKDFFLARGLVIGSTNTIKLSTKGKVADIY